MGGSETVNTQVTTYSPSSSRAGGISELDANETHQ